MKSTADDNIQLIQKEKKDGFIKRIKGIIRHPFTHIRDFCYYRILDIMNLIDIINDKIHNVDFAAIRTRSDMDYNNPDSHHYAPSNKNIIKVFDGYNITDNDNILDIGCGKGRVLYYLSKLPFNKADGIELSKELSNIARDNIQKMKMKSVVYNCDATKFNDYKNYNWFYMYSPFGKETMRLVINNIEADLNKDTDTYIIYAQPRFPETITENGYFKLIDTIKPTFFRNYKINIYYYNSSKSSN